MPQLVAVAIAEIGASLYAYQVGAYLIQYSTLIAYTVVAAGTYATARSMQRTPNFGNLQSEASGKITMTRDTVASRRVIYGMSRVSGPIVFASTNSPNNSGKNEYLHIIVALAGHEVSEFKSIFFNDVQAWDSGSGQSATFPADKLALTYKIGAPSQTAYVMTPATEWTSDHRLNSIASIYARLTADPNVYPNGIPNISATIVGHKLQDEDGNDVNYYDNPALILRHYLLNYFGASLSEIDETSFGAAKDACNYEPYGSGTGKRYTCNYTFLLNTKPAKVIEDILKTCYGKLVYTNGKFVIKVGVYSTPTVSLNEDDLIGGINVTTKSSQANSYNTVRGLFIDGSTYTSSFQAADFVPITSSFYLNEDDNIESQIDIELSGVTDHTIARRIAKLTLLDSRQDLTVQVTTKISGLQLIAGDNVYLSVARYGWTNKVFEVTELNINPDLSIGLVLKETSSDIYDFPVGEDVDRDLSPNTNLPNPFVVNPPVGFSVIETTTIDKDGTVFPSATLNWSASYSGSISDIAVEYKETGSTDFDALGVFPRTDSTFTTLDVEAGKTYMFRARNFNYLGVYSSFVSQSLKINGDNVAPQTPSSIVATGATGSFSLSWVNDAVDTDYKFTKIWLGTTNTFGSSTYQGSISGTTWNKAITTSGSYYAWLQNVDTSNNTSSISTSVNAFVSAIIADGAPGPSGSAGNIQYQIYRRSSTTPATPTGNLTPAFWSTSIPTDDGNALWVSNGLISGADGITLIGSWSTPERLTGKVSWYQTTAPTGATTSSIVIGDLWWDTDDNYKPYRWNGTSWQAVDDGRINPISQSLVSFGGEYALTVTSSGTPRIAGFRIINQSGAESEFTVQSDKFRIYSTANGTITQSFVADANGVYMPQALIRELDAGKITAGTINATVLLTAARLESPEITGSGFMINSQVGMRYQDNNGVLTITGGQTNGAANGAQIDLVGINGAGAGSKGTLVLAAGDVGTTNGDGTIRFRTDDTEQGRIKRDGDIYWYNAVTASSVSAGESKIGNNLVGNDSNVELGYYGTGDRVSYVDFHSADSPPDYSARIIRNSGANGTFDIINTGTGRINVSVGGNTIGYFATDGIYYGTASFALNGGTGGGSGSSGTSGVSGSSGTSGESGTDGSSGTSGETGSSGTSGQNGDAGSSGTSGEQGEAGSSGTSGANGLAGSSGTSGIKGDTGDAGSSGTSGNNGNSGSSGTSGANGTVTSAAVQSVLSDALYNFLGSGNEPSAGQYLKWNGSSFEWSA
jgi:hypothetical protein